MKFKKNKYAIILTYLISRCMNQPQLGKTLLNYLLYYTDFNYYEIYGRSITNETYIKDKNSLIKSIHFNQTIENLTRLNIIQTKQKPYYKRTINKYYLTKLPKLEISHLEYHIIENLLKTFKNTNATQIAHYTKQDPPYILAKTGQKLQYHNTTYRQQTSIKHLMYDLFVY
ncbi:MAG: DUF4065 domain-containing protein [Methanobacteriaceae archaeon]|nr:DUF4065 domain-containing protein [Methanobacteriaceae archaeon]